MGIVAVAFLAVKVARLPNVAMTATCRRTRSAASAPQTIVLALGPTVQDRHVFAFDVASLFQALVKCTQPVREGIRRSAAEKSDHRHRRLLRCAASGQPPPRRRET